MTQQWEPEQTIEPSLALELVQQQFPSLHAASIRLLGAGWDNTAFVINSDLLFRFPRRAIALPLLEAEWCALPKLAPRLPLPIPVPKWRGSPAQQFPWPFLGYKMLPGCTACYANLSEPERASLAVPLAAFLSALHKTPPSLLSNCHVPGDNQSRIDSEKMLPKLLKNFEELALLNLLPGNVIVPSSSYRKPRADTVVHGDFYVRHLLLDDAHRLSGVIDWGDIHIGDPAIDLAAAHSFLPESSHPAFRKAYGEISEETWKLARLRALYSSSLLALFGHHTKDPDILREGMRSLKILLRI